MAPRFEHTILWICAEHLNHSAIAALGRKQQHQQQLFSTSSSSIYSLVPAAPAPTQAPSTCNPLSLAEHRTHVLKLITKWCSDNKENFDLENFELEENVDF
ncbi:unnamed protein product, partial [Rotaria magnacalcarata]